MISRIYQCSCCIMQTLIQNYRTLKVTKSKTRYKTNLGSNIYAKLLFLHARTGCHTAFSISGVGKSMIFKNVLSNKHFQEAALSSPPIANPMKRITWDTYYLKGNTAHSLNSLHHKPLIQNVTTAKSFVKNETLPPIESTLRYHSFQTYFKITLQKEGSNLCATEQRWVVKSNKFIPVLTGLEATNQYVLKMTRCLCKTD